MNIKHGVHVSDKWLSYMNLSRKNGDNIEKFFAKRSTPEKFSYINMKKNGFCPFLDKNKLCGIQKKYGENYLPETCKNFPRRKVNFDTVQIKTLNLLVQK